MVFVAALVVNYSNTEYQDNINNILQRMHFQYILYYIFTSTPTCFGPIGPSSGSYVQ
jgi:hypothetical protein